MCTVPHLDLPIEYQRIQALHGLPLLRAAAPCDLEDLCRHAQEHFCVRMALITLVYSDKQVVWARAGTTLKSTPRSDAFCDHLIGSDDVLVVPDARRDPRFASNPLVTGEPFVRFYAGAPLIFTRDVRLGGLCLLDTEPRKFSGGEKQELAELADEAMFRILELQLQQVDRLH